MVDSNAAEAGCDRALMHQASAGIDHSQITADPVSFANSGSESRVIMNWTLSGLSGASRANRPCEVAESLFFIYTLQTWTSDVGFKMSSDTYRPET